MSKKSKKGVKNVNAENVKAEEERDAGENVKKKRTFKSVLKRYWYWFVVIPVLITVSFVWLYHIGVFNKKEEFIIRSSTPDLVVMPIDSLYHVVVTSNTGAVPVYRSSDPSIADVSEDGFVTANKEGMVKITADFGEKKHSITVTVYSSSVVWYLAAGDTFTNEDVFRAFPNLVGLQGVRFFNTKYIKMEFSEGTIPGYVVADEIPNDIAPVFIYATSPDPNDISVSLSKGTIVLYLVQTAEERDRRIAVYQEKYNSNQESTVEIPADQVDGEIIFNCYEKYVLRPPLDSEGFVQFTVECADGAFPMTLDQKGNFSIDAMIDTFYINIIVGNRDVYRYKCSSVPPTSVAYLTVGEELLFEERSGQIPQGILRFVSQSSKLTELYGDEGDLIGFKAVETTDDFIYIYGYSFEEKDYVTFRFEIHIGEAIAGGGEHD